MQPHWQSKEKLLVMVQPPVFGGLQKPSKSKTRALHTPFPIPQRALRARHTVQGT